MTARNSTSVKWVQSSLRELGETELVVDGAAGPRTTAAIKRFQAAHGLTVDGIAGPATVAALEKALTERRTGELRTMAVSTDRDDDVAADAETGEDDPASAAVTTPGAGYVERRVRVRTYGTTSSSSKLLVNVPATSGTKRLHVLAARALEAMSAAVQRDLGTELKLASGWRAHRWTSREHYEQTLIARYGSVKEGKRWLAYDSPHETGLAMDIGVGGLTPTRSTVDFQRKQPLHQWLVQHASEYGWYPYKTEPWHWEYPVSLEAFASGVIGPDDPGPPEDSISYDLDDEEYALEADDLEEFAVDEP